MPSTNVDKNFERGGVRFGIRMARRLAVSAQDMPWEQRGKPALADRLRRAAEILDGIEASGEVDPKQHPHYMGDPRHEERPAYGTDQAIPLAELWELLEDIDWAVPALECWCVVKIRGATLASGDGNPYSVWTGHLSREQAEEFAPKIAAHYARKASHTSDRNPDAPGYWGGWTDRFVVAWSVCRIRDVIGPQLTAAEYVQGLGS